MVAFLATAQKAAGLNVEVLVYSNTGTEFENYLLDNKIPLRELGQNTQANRFQRIRRIRRILTQYDLVHVHLFPTLYEVAIANTGINTPLIFTEHSTHNRRREKKWLKPLERFIYGHYKSITAISPAVGESLSQWLGDRLAKRIFLVNNGIKLTDNLSGQPATNRKSVLMVSRFVPSKDHKTVIDAIEYVDKDIKFVFAGEGELLDNVRQYARRKGVSDRCDFLGNVENVDKLIDTCTIGVQSSNWEGFGLTALEFMSHGKPIIGSDICGLREVIGSAGLLFTPGDAKMLASHINRLLHDPKEYKHFEREGIEQAKKYSIESTASKMSEVYAAALNAGRRHGNVCASLGDEDKEG